MSVDERAAPLAAALAEVRAVDADERVAVSATRALLASLARPFDRDAQRTHVTASALCVGEEGVVLHRHRRMGRWLQPGGHVDPGEPPHLAALRELLEETGVAARHLEPPLLVHVAVHDAPLDHVHHDCRWLVVAAGTEIAPMPGESTAVRWCGLDDALARGAPDLGVALRKAFSVARALALPPVASWPR